MTDDKLSMVLSPWWMLMLSPATFASLQLLQAPYSKFSTPTLHRLWGPPIPARWAWFIQETPALICVVALFLSSSGGSGSKGAAQHSASGNIFLLSLFCLHYVVRALIFPLLLRGGKPTPLLVVALSFAFCVWNGSMQGYALSHTLPPFAVSSLSALQLLGVGAFVLGFCLNQHADHTLRSLRSSPSDHQYYVPYGGLFRWVTAANYSAELLEWLGWSLACQTLASLAFAVFTFANLAPRAVAYHAWYRSKFKQQYPTDRAAIIPFLY